MPRRRVARHLHFATRRTARRCRRAACRPAARHHAARRRHCAASRLMSHESETVQKAQTT